MEFCRSGKVGTLIDLVLSKVFIEVNGNLFLKSGMMKLLLKLSVILSPEISTDYQNTLQLTTVTVQLMVNEP